MAPIFNLNNEPLFWGINALLVIVVWLLIGYHYARATYERYFELDVDGFDGFRYRDMLFFPVTGLNYLTEDKKFGVTILSTNPRIYFPIISVFWPLKLLSSCFWSLMLFTTCKDYLRGRSY